MFNGRFMVQPIVFTLLMVLAVPAFIGVSAFFYRRLPIALMEYSQRHGRFHGIGLPERVVQGRPARNAPLDLVLRGAA
jgi:hypothetical protein